MGERRSPARGLAAVVAVPVVVGVGILAVVALVLGAIAAALSGISLLGDVELGPGQGTDSARLPIDVAPRTALVDGQTVFVTSDAFGPQRVVSVGVCLREAATEDGGVAACDTDTGARFATDAGGHLSAAVAVPRVITVGGTALDCASSPGRCIVVAASAADFDRSGGQSVSFAPTATPPDLTPSPPRPRTLGLPVRGAPSTTGPPGTAVEVTAEGFIPGEPVLVATCTADFLRTEPWYACDPQSSGAFEAVALASVAGVTDHATSTGTVTTTVRLPATILPAFDPGARRCGPTDPCGIVVAAAADLSRSAYLPVTVTG